MKQMSSENRFPAPVINGQGEGKQDGTVSSEEAFQTDVDVRPPWHAQIVFTGMSLLLFYSLPSLQTLDEIATLSTFTTRSFPHILSLRAMAYLRVAIAVFIWTVTWIMVTCRVGWVQMTPYKPQSKLKMVPNLLVGRKTLYPFTSWSWIMLGIYFTLSSYISLAALDLPDSHAMDAAQHRWLWRATVVTGGIAAPCSLLVAATIRYVMWPAVLKRGGPHSLNSWRNIWMHNANVLFALLERCLCAGMPMRPSEWALAPLFGCLYVLFSWNMTHAWNERKHGPQFIYFFLDTTMPGYYSSFALLALFLVLTIFYMIYASTDFILRGAEFAMHSCFAGASVEEKEYLNFFSHVLVIVVICSLVVRFRD